MFWQLVRTTAKLEIPNCGDIEIGGGKFQSVRTIIPLHNVTNPGSRTDRNVCRSVGLSFFRYSFNQSMRRTNLLLKLVDLGGCITTPSCCFSYFYSYPSLNELRSDIRADAVVPRALNWKMTTLCECDVQDDGGLLFRDGWWMSRAAQRTLRYR